MGFEDSIFGFYVNDEFFEIFLDFMFMMDLSWISLGYKNLLLIY
jgi:hypothetical protein